MNDPMPTIRGILGMPNRHTIRPGDVVKYDVERVWCREGTAIASTRRDGSIFLADTYWQGGSETHILTDAEVATAVVQFNTADYRELPHGERHLFDRYAPSDRQVITSQHGLSVRQFVRLGADYDRATIIHNARDALAEAEEEAERAVRRVEYRREDLARIEAGSDW